MAGPVLARGDVSYLGAFRLPESACGWSTAYSSAGLALRRVDGRLRLITGAHVYSGGLVYEASAPEPVLDPAGWPVADLLGEPCDVYAGRRRVGDAAGDSGAVWTHGLAYDESRGRLYWSFGEYYNAGAQNQNALGYTDLSGTSVGPAHGPWRTDGSVHSQRVRGGALQIPAAFASAHLDGRTLGLGFGGYYCIVGEGSFGPALYADYPPGDETPSLAPVPLLVHPASVGESDHWAWRPTDYLIDAGLDWGRSPEGARGFWAPGDSIEGAAAWVGGSRQAVVMVAELNQGRIWYGDGGLHSDGTATYWYVYDPADLAEVAEGRQQPWWPRPQVWPMPLPAVGPAQDASTGAQRRVAGVAFDPVQRRLYLLQLNGYGDGGEQYPVVHVYAVAA